jgi:hypothetical protein
MVHPFSSENKTLGRVSGWGSPGEANPCDKKNGDAGLIDHSRRNNMIFIKISSSIPIGWAALSTDRKAAKRQL